MRWWALGWWVLAGCGSDPGKDSSEATNPDTTPGSDADTDADSDTDTDSDVDTDADTDSASSETGDTGPTTSPPLVPVQVEPGTIVTCADPSARLTARYVARRDAVPPNSFNWLHGGGIVAADFNSDGHQDILAPSEPWIRYYRGVGDGTFDNVTESVFGSPYIDTTFGNGGAAADYDGDGHLDVYITRYQLPNLLLRNLGDGRFEDLTATACPGCPEGMGGSDLPPTTAASWADMDRDGDLDLFVGNYGIPDQTGAIPTEDFGPAFQSYLYENLGDGTFADVSDRLPQILHDGYTYAGGFHDIDDDGWMDLLVVNDFGPAYPNAAMRNELGVLVPAWEGRGGLWLPTTGMGLGVADVNGDGYLDFLIPEYDKMSYHQSLASGSDVIWADNAPAIGLTLDRTRQQMVGWGAEFADLDNDADLDALVAYGYIGTVHPNWDNPHNQQDAVYEQNGGVFTDVGPEWGLNDRTSGRGFILADMNHDGYLDVLKRDLEGPNLLWISNCGTENWLIVRPRIRTGMNRFAVGARVWIEAGGQTFMRDVLAGGTSFASGGPPEVHVGLAAIPRVDRVRVRWPDGTFSEVSDVDPRQVLTLTRD